MPEHGSIKSQHGVNGIPPIEHAIERRESYSSLDGHPAAMRASLVRAANDIALSAVRPASPPQMHDSKSREHETAKGADLGEIEYEGGVRGYGSPHTLDSAHIAAAALPTLDTAEQAGSSRSAAAPHAAEHSHEGSMNMRGVLIHVLGDALGNIGVVAVGLVIWLSSWHGRFYLDPAISLALTVLIGSSALPLGAPHSPHASAQGRLIHPPDAVRAAARVLLQGVPRGVELADVHRAIERVPGVRAVHELHVWQLSEARAVASVHVRAARDRDFMALAADIRAALHARGVHSCTVQPEYGAWEHDAAEVSWSPGRAVLGLNVWLSQSSAETLCLIGCPPDQACNEKNACCRECFCFFLLSVVSFYLPDAPMQLLLWLPFENVCGLSR